MLFQTRAEISSDYIYKIQSTVETPPITIIPSSVKSHHQAHYSLATSIVRMSLSYSWRRLGFFHWIIVLQTMFYPCLAKLHFPFRRIFADAATTSCAPRRDPAKLEDLASAASNSKKSLLHLIQIPKGVQFAFSETKERIMSILLYQPPVEIIAVGAVSRLIKSNLDLASSPIAPSDIV
jgi:hypothetical protein